MPRQPRNIVPHAPYHIVNRSNGRFRIYHRQSCYFRFCRLLGLATEKFAMDVVAFCVMPNHWHLVVRPKTGNQLSKFMGWLSNTHTRRFHTIHGSVGQGPLYQGRYKAFSIADEEHLATVLRYVERNPVTGGLTSTCRQWQWSSAGERGRRLVPLRLSEHQKCRGWYARVDEPLTLSEAESIAKYI